MRTVEEEGRGYAGRCLAELRLPSYGNPRQERRLARDVTCSAFANAHHRPNTSAAHFIMSEKLRIPLDPITRSEGIRSSFRASDQGSERSDEQGGWSGGGLGLGLGFQTFLAADGGAAEREHMGVVHEPVADGVGDSRLAERFVPTFRRQL